MVRASPRVCHRYLELILLLIFFIALWPACALKLENDLQGHLCLYDLYVALRKILEMSLLALKLACIGPILDHTEAQLSKGVVDLFG